MDTVTLTIDGQAVTVAKGTPVLRAAIEAGISVPYYCYHPGLGVDGSCRVCVVKIEKMGKLQTSCSTACTDGMVVHTRDKDVVDARAGVLEFLLINHPLDCPVCDKGGECPLQDFSFNFGPAESRMDFPRRVFDGEGARADVDFGPTLMLNRNRCILCTRCVRFMREVDGDAQIGIVDRGVGSEIATFREEGVHSLLSGNLMDVCPVGAITTRDYRFKSRPWDNPTVSDTICTLCSKGCSTSAWIKAKPEWAKGTQLVRMTPRLNPAVNSYWMCDIGRFDFRWVEGDTRLRTPLVRQGGSLAAVGWHDAQPRVREALQAAGAVDPMSVRFLVSAHAATEDLFVLRDLVEGLQGAEGVRAVGISWKHNPKTQPAGTQFVVPTTDAPNVNGARDLGFSTGAGNGHAADVSALRRAVEAGQVRVLYVLDPGPDSLGDTAWIVNARQQGTLATLIVQGVVSTSLTAAADIVLPGAAWVERDALFTNDRDMVQGASRTISPPGEAKEDWQILTDIGRALGLSLGYQTSGDVRKAIAAALPSGPYAGAERIAFVRPIPAQTWMETSNPSERWKWDFMYQDLPPVKGHSVQTEGMAADGRRTIQLTPVK